MAIQLAVGQTVYFSWWQTPEYGHNTYAPGYYRIELWAGRGANGIYNNTAGGKGGKVTIYVTVYDAVRFSFIIGAAGDGRSGGWSYRFSDGQWISTYKGGDGGYDVGHGPQEWGGGGGGASVLIIDGSTVAYCGGGGGGSGIYYDWRDPGETGNNWGQNYLSSVMVTSYSGQIGYGRHTSGHDVHYGGGGGGGGYYGGKRKSTSGGQQAAGGYGGSYKFYTLSNWYCAVTNQTSAVNQCDGHGYAAITFTGYLYWSISWTRMVNVNRTTAKVGDLIYGDADITQIRYNTKGQKFYVNPAYGIFSSISYSNVDSPSITNDGRHFQGYQRHRQTAYVAANFYRYTIICDEHCYLVNGEDVLLPGNRYRVKLRDTKVGILLFTHFTISGGLNVTYPARDEIEFEMPNGNVSIVAHYPNRLNTDAYKDIKEQDSFLYEKIE